MNSSYLYHRQNGEQVWLTNCLKDTKTVNTILDDLGEMRGLAFRHSALDIFTVMA